MRVIPDKAARAAADRGTSTPRPSKLCHLVRHSLSLEYWVPALRCAAAGMTLGAILTDNLDCAARAGDAPEPAGYRMQEYRAPVPETLQGASVIQTKQAEALWREKKAAFIDVLPRPPKPALPKGTIYREKERFDIPGSIWLVDTGYGALSPEMEAYFRKGLDAASQHDKAAALVFYCLSNCWMSWNAAKRAVSYGYTQVIWYPNGSDGWHEAGLPLELKEPAPRPGEAP